MLGMSMGLVVETAVAILLAVTIGYCVILNARLKRLHADRDTLQKMVGDLVQATALAKAAVMELKTAALEADTKLVARLASWSAPKPCLTTRPQRWRGCKAPMPRWAASRPCRC